MTVALVLPLLAFAACAGDPAPMETTDTTAAAADTADALPYVYVEARAAGLSSPSTGSPSLRSTEPLPTPQLTTRCSSARGTN